MANKYRVGQSGKAKDKEVVITDVVYDEDENYEATYEVTDAEGNSFEAIDSELTDVV